MSSVYAISFTDSSLPNKTTFTIAPSQHDGPDQLLVVPPHPEKAHTTLTLFGQGALRYGQMINENFVHLLENFASDGLEPITPTVGQTWFDASINTLKVYNTNGDWAVTPGNITSFNFNLLAVTGMTAIIAADSVLDTFTVTGNQVATFPPAFVFSVYGTPSNDGIYTVTTPTTFGGINTTIHVAAVPATTGVVGQILYAPLKLYVAEDKTAIFLPPSPTVNFTVGNDSFTNNNGVYAVVSSFYNSGTNQTEITATAYPGTIPVAQNTSSGQVEVSQAPPSPIIGQIYFNYAFVPPTLTVWDGVNFVPIQTSVATTVLDMNGNSIKNLADSSFNIVARTLGALGAWVISGNHVALFHGDVNPLLADTIYVDNQTGLPGGNGFYTVRSVAFSSPNTIITINETVPASATADGNLTNATGALNVRSANAIYLKIDGSNSPMTGVLDMGSHKITNLTDPSNPQDAMTLSFADLRYVNIIGDTMTGSLVFTGVAPMNMGTNLIHNVVDPVSAQDAATRNYVLNEISKAVSPQTGVPPVFQVLGGNTAAYVFTGVGTPVGAVTPFGQGNIYIDTAGGKIWMVAHIGGGPVTSLDWRQIYPAIYT